ncbi:MAG TPA: PD-(D/E)XK nuclease family protein [Acidobacteriaceae bacterium]
MISNRAFNDSIFVRLKYERDIDLLLAEEFWVSPDFAKWFLAQTLNFAETDAQVEEVFVSKGDAAGESDLVIIYRMPSGEGRFALLIEDKIDAIFQPRQLERYRIRVATELARTAPNYIKAEIIVCAPQNYEDAYREEIKPVTFISYEAIAGFFRDQKPNSRRDEYRAHFIEMASKKRITAAAATTYDKMTDDFWDSVYTVATDDFPELGMKTAKYAKGTTWISFRPHGMPSMPKMVKIDLKGASGFVDLTFNHTSCPIFQPVVKPILEEEMKVHQTGRASAIRICVDPFSVVENFEHMRMPVRKALEASAQLVRFYSNNREFLDTAATNATPQD